MGLKINGVLEDAPHDVQKGIIFKKMVVWLL